MPPRRNGGGNAATTESAYNKRLQRREAVTTQGSITTAATKWKDCTTLHNPIVVLGRHLPEPPDELTAIRIGILGRVP